MARQVRAENTRNAILDAAAAKFDEFGFLGASLSDILTEAGVTKGALYFHFSSKEELASALVDEQFAVWEPLADVDKPGVQTVIDLTQDMAYNLETNIRVRASIRLVIEQGSFVSPSPTAYKQWIDVVHACLLAAKASGDLRQDANPSDVAQLVIGSFTGVQLSSQVLTGRADLYDRLTFMWATLLPALVPPRRLGKFSPGGSSAHLAKRN